MEVKKLKPCYRDVSCRLVVLLVLLWTIICCNIKSRDSNCNNEHHSHILISTAEWRSTYWRFHQEGAKFLSVACAIEFFLMILIVSGQWILQNTICQLFFFMTSNDCLSVKTSIFSMCKAYLPKLFRSILQRFEWKEHFNKPYGNQIHNHRTALTQLGNGFRVKSMVKWRTRAPIVTRGAARRRHHQWEKNALYRHL